MLDIWVTNHGIADQSTRCPLVSGGFEFELENLQNIAMMSLEGSSWFYESLVAIEHAQSPPTKCGYITAEILPLRVRLTSKLPNVPELSRTSDRKLNGHVRMYNNVSGNNGKRV